MKIYYLINLLFVLISCKGKNIENEVKLEILNKEIYFNNDYINNSSTNQVYKNNFDRKKATNILTWKLTNYSNKNYLFIINDDDFFEDPFLSYNYNHIEITDINNIKRNGGNSDISWIQDKPKIGSLFDCVEYNDSIRKSNYQLKGVKLKNYDLQLDYIKNSFILHPNESKTFKSIIRLPILKEIEPKTLSSQIVVNSISEKDKLNLIYEWDSIKIIKGLQDYQIKELRENKVEIFNGILKSNKVQLQKK